MALIKVESSGFRGLPAGIDGDRWFPRFVNEPETITTDRVHMGIDRGNGSRSSHHRFHGVTAFFEDVPTGESGLVVGCDKHSVC